MKLIYRLILSNLKDTNKVVSLALLATFFELLYFVFARNLISQATNDINNQITFSYFSNPLFVLIGFLVTNFISLNFRSYSTKINIKTAYKISSKYSMNSLEALYAESKFKYYPNQGDYVANVVDFPERTAFEFFIPLFISISSALSVFFLSIYMVIWVGYVYLFVVLVLVTIYLLFYRPLISSSSKSGESASFLKSKILNKVADIYDLIPEIDIYRVRKKWFSSHYKDLNKLYEEQSNIVINTTCPKYLIESLTVVSIVISSILFSYQKLGVISVSLIVTQVVSIAFASQRLIPYINYIFSGLNSMRGSLPSLKRLILERKLIFKENKVFFRLLNDNSKLASVINNYKIPNKNKKINCEFELNKHIALCGASGSGKSTLMLNLLGISSFSKAQVFFNPCLLDKKNNLRIGYLPQKNKLFSGTIKENILLKRVDAILYKDKKIEKKIWECLALTKLDNVIRSLPNGLETMVESSSGFLSGGQIQRLAISRAILMEPKLLLMDEATSALDLTLESEILNNLNNLDMTIISIAHRQSAIDKSDYQIFIS